MPWDGRKEFYSLVWTRDDYAQKPSFLMVGRPSAPRGRIPACYHPLATRFDLRSTGPISSRHEAVNLRSCRLEDKGSATPGSAPARRVYLDVPSAKSV